MSQMTRSVTIEDAKQALIVMFNGFNIGGNEVERKVKISAYWSVLCGLPPGVIVAACRDACRCRLGNEPGFPPTIDALYRRAVSYLPRGPIEPPAQEHEISAAERARVRILIRGLADAMRGASECR